MTILFIILSTKQYAETRQQWQKQTWLQGVDYVYLDTPVGEEIYTNAPKKYVQYLKTVPLNYDWYFFCDDDTFVFVDKLRDYLTPSNQELMIGFQGGEFNIYSLRISWCSGGAGFAVSNMLMRKVNQHLLNNRPIVTDETDISFSVWACMSSPDLKVIDNKRFSPFKLVDAAKEGLRDCLTYHYCGEQDFKNLNNLR
jgi:hypothetical protein